MNKGKFVANKIWRNKLKNIEVYLIRVFNEITLYIVVNILLKNKDINQPNSYYLKNKE